MRLGAGGAWLAAWLAASPAYADAPQDGVTADPAAAEASSSELEAAAAAPFVGKMTPVAIDLVDPVGSKISTSLQTFRIVLAEPVMIGSLEAIPAGTTGLGEVVHAKKAGGMGAAGELVLAARYLDLGDRRVRLRSTIVDAEGKSRINGVSTFAAASAASPLPVAWIGFFIKGGEIELPPGTRLVAKLAEDFSPEAQDARGSAEISTTAGADEETKGGINR